jgi:6-phosphofructo-2-kinase/fructose-2,6-biphosphatase
MDVVQRLEPVAVEAERDRGCVCVVAHQAVLRALYGYFQNRPLEEIPALDIPLHTLIELAPQADGTMAETRLTVDVDRALREAGWFAPGGGGAGAGGGEEAEGDEGGAGSSPFAAAAGGGVVPGRRSADDNSGGGGLRVGLVARSLSMADLAAAAVVVVAAKDAPSPRDGAPPL